MGQMLLRTGAMAALAGPLRSSCDLLAQVAHVLDRDDDLDLERLADADVDDGDRAGLAGADQPPRKRATSSSGRWVAERPMRCGGRSLTSSSRSSDRARWAPRLVGARAWISSMITTSTPASVSRAEDVSMRYRLSGVVMSRSGGRRMRAWRSLALVSPVRTPTTGSVKGDAAAARPPGRCRPAAPAGSSPRRRPAPAAARCTGPGSAAPCPGSGLVTSRSMAERKAVSVLPLPVGRADQRVLALGDGRPALDLGRRGLGEGRGEPLPHRRREPLEHRVVGHAATLPTGCRHGFAESARWRRRVRSSGDSPANRRRTSSRSCVAEAATQVREKPFVPVTRPSGSAACDGWCRRPSPADG